MATFSKQKLSASSDGSGIWVASGSYTTIHTAAVSTVDEIWLWATCNNTSSNADLTLNFGGTPNTDNITQTLPFSSGLFLLVPGMILTNGASVSATSNSGSSISIFGFVNNIS
jgi:hypothetical protein